MQKYLYTAVFAAALIGSVGLAAAAGDKTPASSKGQMHSQMTGPSSGPMSGAATNEKLNLTSSQKQTIASELSSSRTAAAPTNFQPSIGAKVPPTIAVRPLPTTVRTKVPAVKNYSYVKLQNRDIVLVDTMDRTVAEIINPQPATTGSGSGIDQK